jgi:PAS domain S-box-containing protein
MSETRTQKRILGAAAERKRVQRITRRISSTLGNDFFQSLVKHIAHALGADCVYVGELIHGAVTRMRTLAVCLEGEWAENFEQDLPGSASAHVVAEGYLGCGADVTGLFPLDPVLEQQKAQAFAGCRLSDSAGQVLGVLAAVYRRPLADEELARSVLLAFSQRVAAELERRREHEALRKADQRYRAFIASSTDGMWRIEFDTPIPVSLGEEEQIEKIYSHGYVAECNEALSRLMGAPSAGELVGARFGTIVPRDDSRVFEELRSAVRSGYRSSVVETIPLDAQGRRMYRLRSQFGIVENGELLRIWGTTRDITELRRAELALEASERRCQEMLERLQLPAVVADPAGQVLFANDALLRLGSWSKEEFAAGNWFDRLADQEGRDRWKDALLCAGSDPSFAHLESHILCAEGPRLVSWDTTLLLDADGGVEGIAAIGTDITHRRAVEAQLRQAQKLEGIGRVAADVAHNFNNLLTVVLGNVSRLLGRAGRSHAARESLSAIQAAAMQCAGLTEQLLAIGCKQPLHPAIFNLNSLIAATEAVVRGILGKKTVLKLRLDSSLRPVNADRAQIERVLIHLATNARDAMPTGGKLFIATANADPRKSSVPGADSLKPGPYVRLTVTDTGAGMSEEVLTRIFDPFFTTKPAGKGTGIGLSTVYGIVVQSGGLISVKSGPGAGACFTIFLPAAEGLEQPRENAESRAELP